MEFVLNVGRKQQIFKIPDISKVYLTMFPSNQVASFHSKVSRIFHLWLMVSLKNAIIFEIVDNVTVDTSTESTTAEKNLVSFLNSWDIGCTPLTTKNKASLKAPYTAKYSPMSSKTSVSNIFAKSILRPRLIEGHITLHTSRVSAQNCLKFNQN